MSFLSSTVIMLSITLHLSPSPRDPLVMRLSPCLTKPHQASPCTAPERKEHFRVHVKEAPGFRPCRHVSMHPSP